MKTILISAVTAIIVVLIAFQIEDLIDDEAGDEASLGSASSVPAEGSARSAPAASAEARAPLSLRVTEPLGQDAWVDASRTAGADHKPLADASSSICYLTKVEIKGIRGPDDSNACRIDIDDFTGYWEVWAEVEEGGQSEVRCNARCLVWGEDRE